MIDTWNLLLKTSQTQLRLGHYECIKHESTTFNKIENLIANIRNVRAFGQWLLRTNLDILIKGDLWPDTDWWKGGEMN
jgi:hypothetical protein